MGTACYCPPVSVVNDQTSSLVSATDSVYLLNLKRVRISSVLVNYHFWVSLVVVFN